MPEHTRNLLYSLLNDTEGMFKTQIDDNAENSYKEEEHIKHICELHFSIPNFGGADTQVYKLCNSSANMLAIVAVLVAHKIDFNCWYFGE